MSPSVKAYRVSSYFMIQASTISLIIVCLVLIFFLLCPLLLISSFISNSCYLLCENEDISMGSLDSNQEQKRPSLSLNTKPSQKKKSRSLLPPLLKVKQALAPVPSPAWASWTISLDPIQSNPEVMIPLQSAPPARSSNQHGASLNISSSLIGLHF